MKRQPTLFEGVRMEMDEAQQLTIDSLTAHAALFDVWVITWSGGKDSTALVTLVIDFIRTGRIPAPKRLIVLRADTGLEMVPLDLSALVLMEQIRAAKVEVIEVRAEMDNRFFVYMLGRGVPPPNSMKLRWCTRLLKLDPMQKAIERIYEEVGHQILVLTGVRIGESAARDARIKLSCGKDDGECGQGWFQEGISDKRAAKLAPLLHWRSCMIWDWLGVYAPLSEMKWNTRLLAEAYGDYGNGVEESLRTGCMACPLVKEDRTLATIISRPEWAYLAPIQKLRSLYEQMREPRYRLRQHEERLKDGSLSNSPYRMGPLTMDARRYFLDQVARIQETVNQSALQFNRPIVTLISPLEFKRIYALWEANTWPQGWTGNEPLATELYQDTRLNQLDLFA